ncbi:MAG: glycine/sarcosine/betaine reductase selenoprotein B family protein [SAR324 cluster bacterium]|nr:glycine/sarcosine/betaine reductase selenoprotein B family protein [SAR324 cluster bacterium]MEE1578252.1 glycine/sarcosine/betaine reductase selenoprotein B family protein [Deltaproteobacteria bacterium]MDP6248225.1 glycine/sarcosine/betaine reductase selenoprotein B family protein [SAR324 cluster bacterium]MDP6463906.1 glycine/sarcosine/betaine reductase selenoprotein B family protein [SAR324 cluster bacterium]MDP6638028.1 glycine/sarcosine/betaine reductase selenoprotein B family protein 
MNLHVHPFVKRLKNRLGLALFKMDFVKKSWQRKYQAVQNDQVPWTPLGKPLEECRLVLVTTGGVHQKNDTPFDMTDSNGDPSFRMISSQAKPEELMITHDYYDHRDADQDLNLVFPWQVMQELVNEGKMGSLTDQFISFMGHIDGTLIETLVQKTSVAAADKVQQMQADIALLVPS